MPGTVKNLDHSKEYYFDEGCYIIEVSNSPDDEAVSIARARVEPGMTTKWHSLDATVERYVILEGEGRVEVGELDAESVSPGDVVLIQPGERQRISNTGSADLIFLAICSPRFRQHAYNALEP